MGNEARTASFIREGALNAKNHSTKFAKPNIENEELATATLYSPATCKGRKIPLVWNVPSIELPNELREIQAIARAGTKESGRTNKSNQEMVVKTLRNFVVLFSIVMAAVVGNAQTALHGKFQLTSQARWGKKVLPAGQYSFAIDSTQQPVRIVIQSADGKTSAMQLAQSTSDASLGGNYLLITGSGANRTVRSMNLPSLGTSLIYQPLSPRERETLYSSAAQTVPVQIAKK